MRLELRDLQLFAALARHENFTRAAEACGISQPALSLRIANLEAGLGMALVRRGARFAGFTEEGEILLGWARRILAENDAMLAELRGGRGEVAGHVVMGVIPTALAFAARVAVALRAAHPRVVPAIRSATATEIATGLAAGRFDIGISYLGDSLAGDAPTLETIDPGREARGAAPPRGRRGAAAPRYLYREAYALLGPAVVLPHGRARMTWAEAAAVPLALLTPDMKNRRIIDSAFAAAGVSPRPVFETNDLATLHAFLAAGGAATIAPTNAAAPETGGAETVRIALAEPTLTRSVAAFLPGTGFEPPAVTAALRAAEETAAAMPAEPLAAGGAAP